MKTNFILIIVLSVLLFISGSSSATIIITLTKGPDVADNVCDQTSYTYNASLSGLDSQTTYSISFQPTTGIIDGPITVSSDMTSCSANIKWQATTSSNGNLGSLIVRLYVNGIKVAESNTMNVTIKSIRHLTAQLYGVPNIPSWNIDPCSSGTLNMYTGLMYVPGSYNELVNVYKWLVPSGWTVNGQTSNGTTWIIAPQDVTVTYPASTTGGSISVKAYYVVSGCMGSPQESLASGTIALTRNANLTLSVNKTEIICTDTNPVTFTVTPALSCATYYWNGTQTPTASNSLTITPDGHNDVSASVTVYYADKSKSLSKALTYQIFQEGFIPIIQGSPTICNGFNTTYYINNIKPGYTINWSLSPNLTQVSASDSTIVISSNSSSNESINATISTPCGDYPRTIDTKSIWVGSPYIGSNYPLAYFINNAYNNVCNMQTKSTSMIIGGSSNVTWSKISSYPAFINWSQSWNDISFYFWDIGQYAVFKIEAYNICGTASYQFGFKSVDCGGGGGCQVTYTLSPNPASTSIKIVPNIPAPCDPINVSYPDGYIAVYDNTGLLKKKMKYKYKDEEEIDVSALSNGLYHIEIFDGKTVVKQNFIVYH